VGVDQVFCFFHTKVFSVHVFAALDDGIEENAILEVGIQIGHVTQVIFDGFLDCPVELVVGGIVETIWETLEGNVVAFKSLETPPLYRQHL